jgi:hypothetical protein
MMPLITTAPITAIGTLRLGFWVSSASGAAASNPPNASTARLKVSSTSVEPPGQRNGAEDRPALPPRARMVALITSSRMTSNAYSTTVTRTPNFRPATTGATTSTPYTIVVSWVMPQKCVLPNTFCTM